MFLALRRNIDRFVITSDRVFRVHGLLNRSEAEMPLGRILDTTVYKPLLGRLLNYGHFTFESAAQDQGLQEIRYVRDIDERDLTIQRVTRDAGLRGGPARWTLRLSRSQPGGGPEVAADRVEAAGGGDAGGVHAVLLVARPARRPRGST